METQFDERYKTVALIKQRARKFKHSKAVLFPKFMLTASN
jgi:hypothetical protein